MDDRVIKLILEMVGTEKLAAAKAAGVDLEATLRKVPSAADAASDGVGRVGSAADKAGNKMAGLGQAGLQTGRVIQDFAQGGLPGVLNNIEGLTMALGFGPGLAGALTLAGVGLFVFKDQIKEVLDDFTGQAVDRSKSHLDRLQDRIKELEAKPIRLAVDDLELANARKEVEGIRDALAAVERFRNLRTTPEKESGASIEKAVSAIPGGGGAVVDLMAKQLRDEFTAASTELDEARKVQAGARQRLDALLKEEPKTVDDMQAVAAAIEREQTTLTDAVERALKVRGQIKADAETAAGKLLEDATHGQGDAQRRAQEEIVRRSQAGGREDIAQAVRQFSPERIKEANEAREQIRQGQEKFEAAETTRREAAKKEGEEIAAWFDKQVADVDAEIAAEKADDKATGKGLKAGAGAQTKFLNDAFRQVTQNTSIDEEAAALDAQLRLQGATDAQRHTIVTRAAGKFISQMSPNMHPMNVGTIAARIARGAEQQVNEQALRAANGGAVNTQQMLGIGQGLAVLAQQAIQHNAQNTAGIVALGAQVRQLQAQGRSNLPRGRAPGR